MEFVSQHDIPAADIAALGAAPQTVERIIPIPVGASRWSLHMVPKDSGPGAQPQFELQYFVGGEAFPVNPAAEGTMEKNEDNIVTREDVVNRVKAVVTFAADPKIDGDLVIRLAIGRA